MSRRWIEHDDQIERQLVGVRRFKTPRGEGVILLPSAGLPVETSARTAADWEFALREGFTWRRRPDETKAESWWRILAEAERRQQRRDRPGLPRRWLRACARFLRRCLSFIGLTRV